MKYTSVERKIQEIPQSQGRWTCEYENLEIKAEKGDWKLSINQWFRMVKMETLNSESKKRRGGEGNGDGNEVRGHSELHNYYRRDRRD